MSDSDISDEDKKIFEGHITKNSDYLLQLIEDIIDVSKIESNQLAIRIKEFDAVPVIDHVVESFQIAIPSEQDLRFVKNIHESSFIVKFDVLRFEQILRNLLSNAFKFTDKGQIEVGCRKGKEMDTFWVKDSGIGISPEDQLIIFDRFMKIDNSKQHFHRGTGIGLFITKQLVEMFGGKIWVESVVGKGSTFYFTIPS
jgi:signal transduction histidine kinase